MFLLVHSLCAISRHGVTVDGRVSSEHTDDTRINVITLSIVLCSALLIEALLLMEFMLQMHMCGGFRKGTEET